MSKIQIRPATVEDRPFLLDSFVRSYQSNSAYAQAVHGQILVDQIEPLLALWTVAVAVAPDDTILGWICWRDPSTVAWVNVKLGVRKRGIARALLTHAGVQCPSEISCAFMPTAGRFAKEAERHGYTLRFRPYLPFQTVAVALTAALASGSLTIYPPNGA